MASSKANRKVSPQFSRGRNNLGPVTPAEADMCTPANDLLMGESQDKLFNGVSSSHHAANFAHDPETNNTLVLFKARAPPTPATNYGMRGSMWPYAIRPYSLYGPPTNARHNDMNGADKSKGGLEDIDDLVGENDAAEDMPQAEPAQWYAKGDLLVYLLMVTDTLEKIVHFVYHSLFRPNPPLLARSSQGCGLNQSEFMYMIVTLCELRCNRVWWWVELNID